jgi:hypothetical protein
MRTHGYSSAADSRLWLIAVLLGVILMLAAASRASAASAVGEDANAKLGAIAQEIVVEDNSLIVDLVSTAGSSAGSTVGAGAIEFLEQNMYLGTTNALVSTTREQFHYLQDNLDISAGPSTSTAREQYHYLDNNLDISGQIAPVERERYDRRQFLSNDNGDGSDVAGSPQPEAAENPDGTLSAGYASGRYDQIQGQAGPGSDSNVIAAPSRGLRYDEMQFLEENVTSMSGVAGDSNSSVRLHHDSYPQAQYGRTKEWADVERLHQDSYPQAQNGRTKEWADAERDRIQFLEDNWLFSEPASELPPLVNEHLAR